MSGLSLPATRHWQTGSALRGNLTSRTLHLEETSHCGLFTERRPHITNSRPRGDLTFLAPHQEETSHYRLSTERRPHIIDSPLRGDLTLWTLHRDETSHYRLFTEMRSCGAVSRLWPCRLLVEYCSNSSVQGISCKVKGLIRSRVCQVGGVRKVCF